MKSGLIIMYHLPRALPPSLSISPLFAFGCLLCSNIVFANVDIYQNSQLHTDSIIVVTVTINYHVFK